MHPLLTPINRFGFYVLAWTPLTLALTYAMAVPGRLGWRDALVLVVPLCVIFQFVCLSSWYTCKALPIDTANNTRLFVTHSLAGVIVSLLWVQAGKLLAYLLSQFLTFQGLDERFAPEAPLLFVAGILLHGLSVASFYVILALEESRAAEARALQTSVLARDAELKALKAQINPHFLFNSLNSISALTSINPEKAREMCILLAEFLRMTLGLGEKVVVPLREELELLQRFLAVEKVRFRERLRVQAYADTQAQACLVPPLILQPLVENAVVHGIANLPEGGTLQISADCSGGWLHISIDNSVDPDAPPSRKGGMGLANVRQRLEARYGKDASLRTTAEEDRFRVWLVIPAETSDLPSDATRVEAPLSKETAR
jgi:two-component system, LytTR family, sensor histidine kinase AlgZ